MGITEYIQQIGAYAGFAAVIGLAVLAALYFSTSRDLRRLREEGVKGTGPALPPPPGQAAQRLQTQGPGPRPLPIPPAGAQPAAASQATIVQPPTAPGARTPAGGAAPAAPPPGVAPPPSGARPPGGAPPPPPPRTAPGRPPRQPAPGPARGRPAPKRPWYQEIEPRFLVLIVAGVLVVGGGIIALVSIGGGGDDGGEPFRIVSEDGTGVPADGGTGGEPKPAQVDPSSVTVAVLNGTAVPGLAARIGDTVEAAGFKRGNIDNAPTQAANESQVLYVPGNEAAAEEVAKELDITQVGEVDAEAQSQAGNAQVVVVVGPDQAP